MKPILVSLILILGLAPHIYAQRNRALAKEEFEAGISWYNSGDYRAAQQHFELALKLNPSNKSIPLWIARSIHHQYQTGVRTAENWATGMEAVAAYERALTSPNIAEAQRASLELLTDMGDEELADRWRLGIANSFYIPNQERSAAFTTMAAKMLECVRTIDVGVAAGEEKALADVGGVFLCVNTGLEYAEKALKFDPNNTTALEHQNALQLEKVKLEKLAIELSTPRVSAASVRWQRPEGEMPVKDAALIEGVLDLRHIAYEKGVDLKSMALRKPAPVYPPEAREAGVSGMVTVSVNVDEEGKPFSAVASTGHYLLRRAAVTAAQSTEFKPVNDLSGNPIKITHTVTYYFTLNEKR